MKFLLLILVKATFLFDYYVLECAKNSVTIESFELINPPANWMVSNSSKPLSISNTVSKDYNKSLSWNWEKGDKLTILPNSKLSFANAKGIDLWVYSKNQYGGNLKFELFTQKGKFTFLMKLGFTGWRAIYVSLLKDISPTNETGDKLVISAPEQGSGTFFIDKFSDPNMPLDSNRSADIHLPFIKELGQQWAGFYRYSQLPRTNSSHSYSLEKIKEFKEMRSRYLQAFSLLGSFPISHSKELSKSVLKKFQDLKLKVSKLPIKGKPIGLRRGSNAYIGEEDYCHLLKMIALHWYKYKTKESANMILKLLEHLENQGYVNQSSRGNINHSTWYMRSLGSALVLSRELLIQEGLLEKWSKNLIWLSQLDIVFENNTKNGAVHNKVTSPIELRLGALVLMDDMDPMKDIYCQNYVKWQTKALGRTEGLRGLYNPDYTSFFHGGFNPGYQIGDVARAMQWATVFLGSSYKFDELQNDIKRQFQVIEFAASHLDTALSLHNRNSFESWNSLDQLIEPLGIYVQYAQDPELSRSYNRLSHSNKENSYLTGFLPLNFGSCAIHRRDNWVATVKGYSKYLWAQEANSKNDTGRYLSNGSLFIHATGHPVTIEKSGYINLGWDWNHIPGTTAVQLPTYEELKENKHIYSEETFCGGTHINKKNGVFGVKLRDNPDISFMANKSYFFFDDKIICLGSHISSDLPYSVHTTLFQHSLETSNENQKDETISRRESDGFIEINDKKGHTYVVASESKINIEKKSIVSQNSKKTQLKGQNLLAWIDHGPKPKNQSYEYLIHVNGAKENRNINLSQIKSSYEVLSKSDSCHTVKDLTSNTQGYVIFKEGSIEAEGILKHVSSPCLVIVKKKEEGFLISICDPDLNIHQSEEKALSRNITITFKGLKNAILNQPENDLWAFEMPKISIQTIDDELKLTLTCKQSQTYSFLMN